LRDQKKLDEAEAAYRKAIALQPILPEPCFNLGVVLLQQARFTEALAALQKVRDLLPARDPRRRQVEQLVRHCQRQANLDARLPAVLQGTDKLAGAAEQIEFARLCLLRKRYAAAARFSRDAFAAEPKLAENVPSGNRYHAARGAALAGCGRGKDAVRLDEQRAGWRQQALDWLRADLAWMGKVTDKANAQTKALIRRWLQDWQGNPDLAGVRDRAALDRLPEAERKQWLKLWADVSALLERTAPR
jgi:tetratricopeptide (TPR) repeat protein